jgi:hypothetical protein
MRRDEAAPALRHCNWIGGNLLARDQGLFTLLRGLPVQARG